MRTDLYDLAIIGGGINGCGIARDAAGRGLRVLLVERDDLAAHTSSASSKLIHGGLRYLETLHFGLVRKSLAEREILLASAPHIMWPLSFVVPQPAHGKRPSWLIRIGLFLYDHLARRRRLHGSHTIDLSRHPAGAALKPAFIKGFEYADGWADDARLVLLNALDAHERGATVLTRCACTAAVREDQQWRLTLNAGGGRPQIARARALINATGPWAEHFITGTLHKTSPHAVRLVRGSHIVVPALFDHPNAYLLQHDDGRVIFVIPWLSQYTLIGTTDVEHSGDPGDAKASTEEIAYLCNAVGCYFERAPTPADVIHSFAGVRPLLDDGEGQASKVTRDYSLTLDDEGAPLLNIFGGKLTTYRTLAEEALARLAPLLAAVPGDHSARWTANSPLPGGDIPGGDFTSFLASLLQRYPQLHAGMLQRLAHAYGTRALRLLEGISDASQLGTEVLPGLHERELDYLIDVEWARNAQDVLWRRSKLGLHLAAQGPQALAAAEVRLDAWMMERLDGGRS